MIEEENDNLDELESGDHPDDMVIGTYQKCRHIASGLVSEVYRSGSVALKVITETHDVEPHNPLREVKVLQNYTHSSIISLQETFRDAEGHLVLVLPYMPLTLAKLINRGPMPLATTRHCFAALFAALDFLHTRGIIHRDVKPSNVLLSSPMGSVYLSDFGTVWHPEWSLSSEPLDQKVLDVGTTCYRAPETLFGNKSYGTTLDIWSAGTMLAECLRSPPKELFESREAHEYGNQLGLILSIFKTLGTPTRHIWPEAVHFTTPPFDWYQSFPGHDWEYLLPNVDLSSRDLVSKLVCYESGSRLCASKVCDSTSASEKAYILAGTTT